MWMTNHNNHIVQIPDGSYLSLLDFFFIFRMWFTIWLQLFPKEWFIFITNCRHERSSWCTSTH